MDDQSIGSRCAVCNRLDYLPFQCTCGASLCLDHRTSHSSCERPAVHDTPTAGETTHTTCQVCHANLLHPLRCPSCGALTCPAHRHDHACPADAPPPPRAPAEQRAPPPLPPAALRTPQHPLSDKNAALAAKVALLRLKSKAVVDPGIPPSRRVFLLVRPPVPHAALCVCADSATTVGRLVDKVALLCQLVNRNNVLAAGTPGRLYASLPGVGLLDPDAVLSSVLQDGSAVDVCVSV